MSLEDTFHKIMNDPKKRVRLFKFIWIVGYAMLVLGSLITVYVLYLNM